MQPNSFASIILSLAITCKFQVTQVAEDQPRLNQGIRRRDGVGEDQETTA